MKKLLFIFLGLITIKTRAQEVPATYAADFKLVWEAAKKYYKTEKAGTPKVLENDRYLMEVPCKTHFQNAAITRLVIDKDEVYNHNVRFNAGTTKDGAAALLRKFIDATKTLLPENFKESSTVAMHYVNQLSYTLDFNSDVFAEVAKKPSVIFGLLLKDGTYYVDVAIMAPVFTY